MKFDPQKHHRRSIRLQDYDYNQPGVYFVTIVTQGRRCLLGEIIDGKMCLNEAGQTVWEVWRTLPVRYPHIKTVTAIVMPNHFHGIIEIDEYVGAIHELPLHELPQQQTQRRRMTLPLVVGYFKMNTAKRINKILGKEGVPVWQRNYYEHIIRHEVEYNRIHQYIETNPSNWLNDEENTINIR